MVTEAVVTVTKAAVVEHPEIARAPVISPAIHPAPLLPGLVYSNYASILLFNTYLSYCC